MMARAWTDRGLVLNFFPSFQAPHPAELSMLVCVCVRVLVSHFILFPIVLHGAFCTPTEADEKVAKFHEAFCGFWHRTSSLVPAICVCVCLCVHVSFGCYNWENFTYTPKTQPEAGANCSIRAEWESGRVGRKPLLCQHVPKPLHVHEHQATGLFGVWRCSCCQYVLRFRKNVSYACGQANKR